LGRGPGGFFFKKGDPSLVRSGGTKGQEKTRVDSGWTCAPACGQQEGRDPAGLSRCIKERILRVQWGLGGVRRGKGETA